MLELRKIPEADIGKFRDIMGDPITIRNSGRIPTEVTLKWAEERLKTVGDLGIYEDDTLVGAGVTFTNDDGNLEVGYCIGADFRGRGYATRALGLLVAQVRADGYTGPIYASYAADNPVSGRVLEKQGFKKIGMGSYVSLGRGGIEVEAVKMRLD